MLAFVLFALLLVSCSEDKLYYGSDRPLEFSADTISFDTIFTAKGSAVRALTVYNPYKNPMVIEHISHTNPVFKLNIDGQSSESVRNLRIEARDSVRIMVQTYIDPTDDTHPIREMDELEFLCNGMRQQVVLMAFGRNVKRMRGRELSSDTLVTSDVPILVQDSLVVSAGTQLRLGAGAVLYFEKKASLIVYGSLVAEGSADAPVLLRGDRSDYMNTIPPLSYDQSSSQWVGVCFRSGATNNLLDNVILRNPTIGISIEPSDMSETVLAIRNSQIYNASGDLIQASKAKVLLENSLFYNAGGYLLNMAGGECDAYFCTFANYYQFSWGGRTSASIRQANYYFDRTGQPVSQSLEINLMNSIVYGSWTMELSRDEWGQAPLNYNYYNCLLKVKASAVDAHFHQCYYNEDPAFQCMVWDAALHPFEFDFHLTSSSSAIGRAKQSIATIYPVDLDGKARTTDGSADIGCYEYY